MGFSLVFEKIKDGEEIADIDRKKLEQFLKNKGLIISEDKTLRHQNGDFLTFDGVFTDLHLAPLDSEKPLSGGIDHATLSAEECSFIYELCEAVGWLIINPQGDPSFIIPNENHAQEDIPEDFEDIVFIENAQELQKVLSGGFSDFQNYLKQILGKEE